jgi:hypothetical protein
MRRLLSTIAITAVAAGLLGACGSNAKSSSSTGTNAPGVTTTSSSGGNSGGDSINALTEKQKTANFYVTYREGSSSISVGQDGKGNSVYTTPDSEVIGTKDGTITCSGTGSSATCVKTTTAAVNVGTFATLFGAYGTMLSSLSSNPALNVKKSSETIVGRDATCVTIDLSSLAKGLAGGKVPVGAGGTFCFDKETGIYLKLAGAGAEGLVATAFRSATAADFTPPAKVTGA